MLPRAAGVHVVNAIDNNVMVFSFTQGALLSSKNYTSEKRHCPRTAHQLLKAPEDIKAETELLECSRLLASTCGACLDAPWMRPVRAHSHIRVDSPEVPSTPMLSKKPEAQARRRKSTRGWRADSRIRVPLCKQSPGSARHQPIGQMQPVWAGLSL